MANRGNDRSNPAQQGDVDNISSDTSRPLTRDAEESERIRGVGDEEVADEGDEDDVEDEEAEIDEEEDEDGSF